MTMLGDKLDAARAKEWGLLYDVVPGAALLEVSLDIAKRLAAMPTRGLGLTKRGFNAGFGERSRHAARARGGAAARGGSHRGLRRGRSRVRREAQAELHRGDDGDPKRADTRRRRRRRGRDGQRHRAGRGRRGTSRHPRRRQCGGRWRAGAREHREGDRARRREGTARSRRRRRAARRASTMPASSRRDYGAFAACGLVIEAIVEDLAVKRALFAGLEKVVRAGLHPGDEHVVAVGGGHRRRLRARRSAWSGFTSSIRRR